MSLVVCVRGPEGIALGSDSRRVIVLGNQYLMIDDSPKVVGFASQPHVGALFVGYGGGIDDFRGALLSADGHLPRARASVREVAQKLVEICAPTAPTQATLIVAGYDEDGTSRVFLSDVPERCEPVEHEGCSIVYAGQREFIDRLLQGYDARLGEAMDGVDELDSIAMKIPLDRITLQGTVELARFLIETTIGAQRFIEGICGVGGAVHLATVCGEGFRWVQRPEVGERKEEWRQILDVVPAVMDVPPDGIGAATYLVMRDAACGPGTVAEGGHTARSQVRC